MYINLAFNINWMLSNNIYWENWRGDIFLWEKTANSLNPYSSYVRDYYTFNSQELDKIKSRDSHNSVIVYQIDEVIKDPQESIDYFISSKLKDETLSDFKINERETVTIMGEQAICLKYSEYYSGFLDAFEGIFAAFQHNNYVVEIYVLFKYGDNETENAFNLLSETFRITH